MARVKAKDKADARGAVIAAASRLFAARGFDGTPLQAVADELGVSKAAVLHHFPSKEALRAAVLGAMLEHWQQLLPTLLLRASASEDRFDAVFDALLEFFAADHDRARLVLREALDEPREAMKILRKTVKPWLDGIGLYVERGREKGEHHEDLDPQAYVALVFLLVVATAGVADVAKAAIDGDARGRAARELKRIARTALFRG